MFIRGDNYRAEPGLWIANQAGHMGLGAFLVFLACLVWFGVFGEFPERLPVWACLTAGYYLIAELFLQRSAGADALEDTMFTCVYGAGSMLWTFREVQLGSDAFYGQISELVPFAALASVHLAIGAGLRVYQRYRSASP